MMKLASLLLASAALALASCSAPGKPYPLDTCVVSGDKLGEMGKPYVFVKNGQQVKLCCDGCLTDFNKDPDKYLKKIAAKSEGKHSSS
jgi:hypothetical protein